MNTKDVNTERMELDQSIRAGAEYLRTQQEECGSFWILTSTDPQFPMGSLPELSSFGTACILYCLEWLDDDCVSQVRKKALAYLTAETSARGLCRYLSSFSRSQMLGGKLSIPFTTFFDVDTTSCVSAILKRHQQETKCNNAESLLANLDENGCFRTWLLQEPIEEQSAGFPYICLVPHQNRTCAGVNANALFYLGENTDTRPAAQWLEETFRRKAHRASGVYYTDEIVLFYLYSRAYFAGVQYLEKASTAIMECLEQHQRPDGSFGTPLQTAMAVCTLQNFGIHDSTQESIFSLLRTQDPNGSWPRSSFYVGQDDDVTQEWRYRDFRRVYNYPLPALYFGSEEITTAYCLEALSRYRESAL